jgi:hypothetical protein
MYWKASVTDEAFRLVHHLRLVDRNATINRHRTYCESHEPFAVDGNNELVQLRLKLVLQAYQAGGFKSGKAVVFAALADAAFQEIPPTRKLVC